MAIEGNIELAAQRLLMPKATLPAFFFDYAGRFDEEKRQALLKRTEFLIAQTIGKFSGLVVDDIAVVGSMVSFLYHEKSDIDLLVLVHNQNCPYLPQGKNELYDVLRKIRTLGFNHRDKSAYERNVDTSFHTCKVDRFSNMYSLKDNKWVVYYDASLISGISVQDLVGNYHQRCAEVCAAIKKVPINTDGTYSSVNKEKLEEIVRFLTREMRNASPLDWMTYKLMRSQRKIPFFCQKLICSIDDEPCSD